MWIQKFTAIQQMKLGMRQGTLAAVIGSDREREAEADQLIKDARQHVKAAKEFFKEVAYSLLK